MYVKKREEMECDMICDECKECVNYKVCENGCHGNVEPCEYFDNGFMKSISSLKGVTEKLSKSFESFIEVESSKVRVDPSRRRFEAIACRGRNRKNKRK